MPRYSEEPRDREEFTRTFDRFYTRFARGYDLAVRFLPVWKTWLRHALPHLRGPRVLEVSFGTGYLLTQYAGSFEAHGIDYNERMVATAWRNLRRSGKSAALQRANVEALPYRDGSFDSVLCTMAFSGYPDAGRALAEMTRVLKRDGRLILIDVNHPADGNRLGEGLTRCWMRAGDVIRDMRSLLREFSLDFTEREIGGFGSVHLYLARKRA